MTNSAYHHGDLRASIEAWAWQEVVKVGFQKLSLRAGARAAHVDPSAVYRHFKSKDDILAALSRRAFIELAEALADAERLHQSKDARERLLAIGLSYVRYATDNPNILSMMFEIAGRLPDGEVSGTDTSDRDAYRILQQAVSAWRPEMDVAEVDILSYTLWSVVHGVSTLFNSGLGPPNRSERESHAARICQTVLGKNSE